jgi:hypothetical protein
MQRRAPATAEINEIKARYGGSSQRNRVTFLNKSLCLSDVVLLESGNESTGRFTAS